VIGFALLASFAACAARRTESSSQPRPGWQGNLVAGLRHRMTADSARTLFGANGFDCTPADADGFSCVRRSGSLLYVVPSWLIFDVVLVDGRLFTVLTRQVTRFGSPDIGRRAPDAGAD